MIPDQVDIVLMIMMMVIRRNAGVYAGEETRFKFKRELYLCIDHLVLVVVVLR